MKKKILIVLLCLVGLLFISGFIINPVLERFLETYVSDILPKHQNSHSYEFNLEKAEVAIYRGRLILHNVHLTPNKSYREQFRAGETPEKMLKELRVNRISLNGLSLFNFLWDDELDLYDIRLDSVNFNLYLSEQMSEKKALSEDRAALFNMDSIHMPGIDDIELSSFTMDHYALHIIRGEGKDTLSSYPGRELILNGLQIRKKKNTDSYFEFIPDSLELKMSRQEFRLGKSHYQAAFNSLDYSYQDGDLKVKGVRFNPAISRERIKEDHAYSYEVYAAEMDLLHLNGFRLESLLHNGTLLIDLVQIDSLNADIFREKSMPYNTSVTKNLINESVAALQFPLHINSVHIRNSFLRYREDIPQNSDTMELFFKDLDARINYLTSVTDSTQTDTPLKMVIQTQFLNEIPLQLKVVLPYHTRVFHYSGYTEGGTAFHNLNPILFPTTYIKINEGYLDGMHFHATGNPYKIQGELTLLYSGLKAEIYEADYTPKKTVSWLANTLVRNSNPNNRGVTIVGDIDFDRVPYKGTGNYLWKGIESGIVNTLNPFGKKQRE